MTRKKHLHKSSMTDHLFSYCYSHDDYHSDLGHLT